MLSKPQSRKWRLSFLSLAGWTICGLSLLTFILTLYLKNHPRVVESFYVPFIGYPVVKLLNAMTRVLPFSLAEILFWFHSVLVLGWLTFSLINLLVPAFRLVVSKSRVRRGKYQAYLLGAGKAFLRQFRLFFIYGLLLYMAFIWFWGINYLRPPLSETWRIPVVDRSSDELIDLCKDLIKDANQQRAQVSERPDGTIEVPYSNDQIMALGQNTFDQFSKRIRAKKYTLPYGQYGRPKAVASSELMCYTGITGVYMPFTGEANVNVAAPKSLMLATVLHEIAHQRGIASEDEANFMAYLASQLQPAQIADPYVRYSGTLLALIHSMNALYKANPDVYFQLRDQYDEAVSLDLRYNALFWKKYEGQVSQKVDRVNDTYLKINGQTSGVASYGEMVDLLLGLQHQQELKKLLQNRE